MNRLKNKEESALKELMNVYGDYLLRTAYLLVKDKQLAEEVVQDTFITAYQKIHQLDEEDKLKSWLTTITVNLCKMQMRKWSFKSILSNFEFAERVTESEQADGPEAQLLLDFQNQSLSESIQKLDYKYREVIILYYFNEMKISEMAMVLAIAENTVKTRLKRGRSYLKEIIEKGEDESATQRKTSG
ncbi:RNA polymerase sigma factor [Sutcliffiella horikoshii]|uniref:RNA polymerase sigma factor n=1 Tax=Sutcliffiella horikoshii TaxID=79883 RepID=UPI00299DCA22|nr:sigma-70 family RNA polymerase sigma factor [Sutcliffiella horikoshii]